MDLAIGKYRIKMSLQRYQILELVIIALGILAIFFSFLMHSRFFLNHILNQNAVADLIAYNPLSAELLWPNTSKHYVVIKLLGLFAFIWGWIKVRDIPQSRQQIRTLIHSVAYIIVGIVLMNLNDAITMFELLRYAKQV